MGCNISPESINRGDTCKTKGGISKKFHYALLEDIDAPFPAKAAEPLTLAENAVITDDFTMVVGKTFHTIDSDIQKSSLEVTAQGEIENKSSKNTFTFSMSGENKALEGWINSYKNKDLIFAITDNDGTKRLLGNDLLPAKISDWNYNSGTAVGDNKTLTVTIEADGDIAPIFEGPAGIPLGA